MAFRPAGQEGRPVLARVIIMWLVRRARRRYGHTHMTKWLPSSVVSGSTMLGRNVRVANRYYPALLDEIQRGDDTMHRPLPWWAPFNVLLHHWVAHDDDLLHDHPRRSLTICLRGELTEITPWGERTLRPGSLVLRGHDYIHGFRVTPEQSARTWTIFVVGRRRWLQNTYAVTRRTGTPER